jgi:very-short-patch-repair endonuclease
MSALKSTTQLGRLEHWTELIENSKEPIGFENESIKLINGYQPFDEWCKENGKDDLLAEWIPENGKKPNEISFHSAYSAKWKCKTCGREWKAVVRDRTLKNEGCGKCKHGTHTSFPESAVYFYVKRYLPDAIQDYTCNWLGKKHLDVYLESSSVAIEYDGAAWHRDIKKDIEKDEICCNNGVKLFRVRESGCPEIKSTSTVIDVNKDTLNSYINLESSIHNLLSLLLNDAETERVVDINISRDYDRIFEMCEYKKGKASFAAMRPDLVCEWDYEQNGVLRPENFTECSGVAVWFICHRCGKRWKTEICNRKHCGCPSCGNKEGKRKHDIAKLKNARQYQTLKMVSIELKTMSEKDKMNFKVINLKITNPEILKYWSPENNASPLEFTKGSNYSVLWKCPKCGTTFI